jgi:hypothetical protein
VAAIETVKRRKRYRYLSGGTVPVLAARHTRKSRTERTATNVDSLMHHIIKQGIGAFINASKKHRALSLSTPPVPRVLDYQRTFGQFAHIHVMQ